MEALVGVIKDKFGASLAQPFINSKLDTEFSYAVQSHAKEKEYNVIIMLTITIICGVLITSITNYTGIAGIVLFIASIPDMFLNICWMLIQTTDEGKAIILKGHNYYLTKIITILNKVSVARKGIIRLINRWVMVNWSMQKTWPDVDKIYSNSMEEWALLVDQKLSAGHITFEFLRKPKLAVRDTTNYYREIYDLAVNQKVPRYIVEASSKMNPSDLSEQGFANALKKRLFTKKTDFSSNMQTLWFSTIMEVTKNLRAIEKPIEHWVKKSIATDGTIGEYGKGSPIEKYLKKKGISEIVAYWQWYASKIISMMIAGASIPEVIAEYMIYMKDELLNGRKRI